MPDPEITPNEAASEDIDPSRVRDYIAKGEGNVPENAIPLDLSPDEVKAVTEDAKPQNDKPRTKLPADPFLTPESPSVQNMNTWQLESKLSNIEVTEQDKSLFFKHAISGETKPFQLTINIPGLDVDVVIRTLNHYEDLLVLEALREDSNQENSTRRVKDMITYTTFHQYYMGYLRVISVNGVPKPYKVYDPKDYEFFEKDKQALRVDAINWALKEPTIRWDLMLHGLWVYEGKMKILKENFLNRDFWKPADTV